MDWKCNTEGGKEKTFLSHFTSSFPHPLPGLIQILTERKTQVSVLWENSWRKALNGWNSVMHVMDHSVLAREKESSSENNIPKSCFGRFFPWDQGLRVFTKGPWAGMSSGLEAPAWTSPWSDPPSPETPQEKRGQRARAEIQTGTGLCTWKTAGSPLLRKCWKRLISYQKIWASVVLMNAGAKSSCREEPTMGTNNTCRYSLYKATERLQSEWDQLVSSVVHQLFCICSCHLTLGLFMILLLEYVTSLGSLLILIC